MARTSVVPGDYRAFLDDLKGRIRSAQIKASLAVNRELIQLYWDIGRAIVLKQKGEGWGTKVIDRLADDLQKAFPGLAGFSRGNIYRMRAFYLAYELSQSIVAQPVRQLEGGTVARTEGQPGSAIVAQPARQLRSPLSVPPPPVAELPWGHNVVLIERVKDPTERLWYAQQTIDLKTREFEPEFAGKMNFYLSAVDDRFRQAQDQPSIGLILCKKRSRVIAEYALRHLERPVGVARYVTRLTERLPRELAGRLPTVKEIEAELMELSKHRRRRGQTK